MCYSPPSAASVGDSVRVTGTIYEYNGLTELSPTTSVVALGRGYRARADADVPIGIMRDSAEAYEGSLVSVGACVVGDVSAWNTQYPAFTVGDGHNSAVVVKEWPWEYEPAVGDSFRGLIGVVDYYSGDGWELAPRSDADIDYIDHRAPALRSISAVGEREINVVFNEALSPTGLDNVANYRVIDQTDPDLPRTARRGGLPVHDGAHHSH